LLMRSEGPIGAVASTAGAAPFANGVDVDEVVFSVAIFVLLRIRRSRAG
jgi:hypothetical protein